MSGEEKPIFLRKDQRPTLERARDLLKEAVDLATELAAEVNVLGLTEEERALTLRAFDGLTPEQIRHGANLERQLLGLHQFLDGEEEMKP
jgi:hypothetical protein